MKEWPLLVLLSFAALCAIQAQPDQRFEGIWTGRETLTPRRKLNAEEETKMPKSGQTTIAIAKGGTLVGIEGGVCSGRFNKVHRAGETLSLKSEGCHLKITISPDGQTLTEEGSCDYATAYTWSLVNGRHPVSWIPLQINGTFHRAE